MNEQNMEEEEEGEELTLPADTLQILNEFWHEKALQEAKEEERHQRPGTDINFTENWQLSQFWYNDETKRVFGRIIEQIKSSWTGKGKPQIALLSCPSLYGTLKAIHDQVHLFEYDRRFAAYGEDFIHYDYKHGQENDYLAEYRGRYDVIVADPPFLSEECIEHMAAIIQRLQKPSPDVRIIFCSGVVVEEWLCNCLPSLHKCRYQPQHHRNLGNEFATYANFDLDKYIN